MRGFRVLVCNMPTHLTLKKRGEIMKNIGLDIDDVIFKTSNELKKLLDGCDDEEIIQHKLDIMRGEAVNKKVGDFLQSNVIPTI